MPTMDFFITKDASKSHNLLDEKLRIESFRSPINTPAGPITGGSYILVLTSTQWETRQKMGTFTGLNVNVEQGADGQYTMKFSEADFVTFQVNQAKAGSPQAAPAGSTQFNISMDASGCYILVLSFE